MRFFAAVDALPSLESMKFPVFSLLTGNFGLFRDEFAVCPIAKQCELSAAGSRFLRRENKQSNHSRPRRPDPARAYRYELRAAPSSVALSASQPWMAWTTIDPSPTLDATRLTELARTSPTAKMPGTVVSSGEIGVFPSTAWPVLTNPFSSTATQPLSQFVLGTAPIIKKRFDVG